MKLINADKVIETLKTRKKLFCRNQIEFRMLSPDQKSRVDEIDTCIAELVNAEEVQTTDTDSDTISRAKAIDALRAMQTYKLFAGDDMLLIDQAGAQTELMMLPSAQPEQRTGKWIPQDHNKRAGNISTCVYCYPICSKCGKVGIETYKYCPMCGAKMEVTT